MPDIAKHPLVPNRIRGIPKDGFSWVDRRFVRDGFAGSLGGPELLLYFFLCSVADREGLSFYGSRRICRILKLSEDSLERARSGLVRHDLVAYRYPLYQVLSLPDAPDSNDLGHLSVRDPGGVGPDRGGIASVGDILKRLR
jgi:hypothetical protein